MLINSPPGKKSIDVFRRPIKYWRPTLLATSWMAIWRTASVHQFCEVKPVRPSVRLSHCSAFPLSVLRRTLYACSSEVRVTRRDERLARKLRRKTVSYLLRLFASSFPRQLYNISLSLPLRYAEINVPICQSMKWRIAGTGWKSRGQKNGELTWRF